jgi:hypothetical protein
MNDKEHRPIEMPDDRDGFLEWAASVDEGVPSVGGLAARGGLIEAPEEAEAEESRILHRLVEFALREGRLSIEVLAELTHVELSELKAIESYGADPERETLDPASTMRNLPPRKLLHLAGFIAHRDSRLSMAAARLAARSDSTTQFDPEGRDALEEFAQALAEATD